VFAHSSLSRSSIKFQQLKLHFKNNFIGYFQFYYSVIGYKLVLNLALCVLVSLIDGVGLAMFMPLLQAAGQNGQVSSGKESLGQLHHITDFISQLGFTLTINVVLVLLVILFSLKGLLKFLQFNYQLRLRYQFMRTVRFALVDNLQGLSYSSFLKLNAGRIHNTLVGEVQRLYQTMNYYFMAAQAATMLITYIFLAFLANFQFALLVAIGAAVSNILYKKIYKATKKASVEVSQKGHDFNGFLVQAIQHYKYLKSTNYFRNFADRLKMLIKQTELLNKKMGFFSSVISSVKEPIIIIIVSLVIYLQVNLLGSSLPTILLSLLLFYRSLSFLMSIQNYWQEFIQNIGAMKTVSAMLDEMSGMQEAQQHTPYKSLAKEICLKKLSFSYGSLKVLDNINITIRKNQTIALVGESGSGKTTLANIIAGLIQPDYGDVQIDNIPLNHYNIDSFRKKIGYISQEPVIFNDNIFNNITFWDERTPENMEKFQKIIRLASLSNYMNELPEKEDTFLGDNGMLISGGQKQRISIARELYKNAELLIFDEATSSLDSETEKIIQDNIEKLHGSFTMVIIAHRLSTIKYADTIYLLDKGKIASSGTFTEMLDSSQRFKHMVALQNFQLV
jgi:ABC-type multidrug transport system fused ATPase/permease subunit